MNAVNVLLEIDSGNDVKTKDEKKYYDKKFRVLD